MARIRFHFDEHVPRRLALALRERGIDVTIPADVGLKRASDRRHLEFARAEGRVLVTNDRDYLRLHAQHVPHCGIALYADQHRSIGSLVESLVAMADIYDSQDMLSHVEYI